MVLDFEVVKTSLYDWMITVVPVGMPVIYWQPNAPRPTIPYVTLFLGSINAINQDYNAYQADANGDVFMKGDRQFTLSIQAYGNDPLTVLENVRISLQKQSVLDLLRSNGIVFYQSLAINDITDLVDSRYERRAQLDVLLGIGQVYSDNPGYFDEIEVQETVVNQIDDVVFDDTITILAQ